MSSNPLVYEPGVDYPPEGPNLLAGLRDGAWLDVQEFPPLRYSVPGLIPEGSVLLVGPPKIGKSWLVLALGLGCALGGTVFGIKAERRRVLYLALEDGDRRMQDRCRKLLAGEPIPREFEYMTRIAGPGYLLDTVHAWLDRQHDGPPLVILDTLGKVMPAAAMGESAYQRDYRIGSAVKRLADEHPGMTMLTNHHDRKANAEDFIDSVSGTHGLAGAADTVAVLTRPRHETAGLLKVTGRDVPEGEYAITFVDGSTWMLDGASLTTAAHRASQARMTQGLGDRSAEILAFVADYPDGVRAAQVELAFGPDARRYLARLVDAGRLSRPSRGLYTPVPTVPASQWREQELGQRDAWDSPTGGDSSPGGLGAPRPPTAEERS